LLQFYSNEAGIPTLRLDSRAEWGIRRTNKQREKP